MTQNQEAFSGLTSGRWDRLLGVTDLIGWTFRLQLAWCLGAVAGGIVFGVGPATLAAAALVRRRDRDGSVRLSSAFRDAYRQSFWTGQLLILPVVGGAVGLAADYLWWSTQGREATVQRLITAAALLVVVAVLCWLPTLVTNYDLPTRRCVPTALRLVLARPWPTLLMMFVTAALVVVSKIAPPLLCTLSIGMWLQATGWLCLRFFASNERRLEEAADDRGRGHLGTELPVLPTEPLRLH